MTFDTANKTVSLAKSIIELIREFDLLINSAGREERRYAELLSSRSVEQNVIFLNVSKDYFLIIADMHKKILTSQSDSDTLSYLNELMSPRDALILDRSALDGAMRGLQATLQRDAPSRIRALLSDYSKYVEDVRRFFYATNEDQITGTSWCSDLFELAYYEFQPLAPSQEVEPFSSQEWRSLMSGQLVSIAPEVNRARFEVAGKIAECKSILETRASCCAERYSVLRESLGVS